MRDLEFFAYHGTDDITSEKILASQVFIIKKNRRDHWLGDGAYFYREDYQQALGWAITKFRYRSTLTPTVLEAKINAPFNKVLHLDTRGGLEALIRFLEKVDEEVLFEPQKGELSTHTVFSMMDPEYVWVIIKTFAVKSRFDKNQRLKKLTFIHNEEEISYRVQGTQVCVKNNEAIVQGSINKVSLNKEPKVTMAKKIVVEDEFPWKSQ